MKKGAAAAGPFFMESKIQQYLQKKYVQADIKIC